ncbi:MAG TPA: nuclear transport factor 2 family protein [Mizugakiibacter sp.]
MPLRTLLPALLCACLLPNAHAADASARVRGEIEALEHQWLDAAQSHDRAALDRILADDFVDVSSNGAFRSKADALAGSNAPPGATQTLHELRVRVYGDCAIANGVNVVHSDTLGWTAEVPFTDVFVRRHGRWQAVSAQETARRDETRTAYERRTK